MARKEITLTIDAAGRDAGKVFHLTEMSASQAERWATRALMALMRSGIDVPEDVANIGLAGIASMGLRALGSMQFHDAEPLLEEMMGCVQIIPDPSKPAVKRALVESDIEEIRTRLKLRQEVFELITGFSIPVAL